MNISYKNAQNDLTILNVGNHNSGGNPHNQYKLLGNVYNAKYLNENYLNKYIKIADIYSIGVDDYCFAHFDLNMCKINDGKRSILRLYYSKLDNTVTLKLGSYEEDGLLFSNLKFIQESNTTSLECKVGVYWKVTSINAIYGISIDNIINKDIKIDLKDINLSVPLSEENLPTSLIDITSVYKENYTYIPNDYNEGFEVLGDNKLTFKKDINNVFINVKGIIKITDLTKKTILWYDKSFCPTTKTYESCIVKDTSTNKLYNGIISMGGTSDNQIKIESLGTNDISTSAEIYINFMYTL